jgi:hypothetical protein
LQGTNGHADQLGDLLSALSSLNEIPDLLDSFRSKLYLPSTNWGLRGKLFGLHHFLSLREQLLRLTPPAGQSSEIGAF